MMCLKKVTPLHFNASRSKQGVATPCISRDIADMRRERNHNFVERIGVTGREVSFEKGSLIFSQGQNPDGIYLILEGTAKLSIGAIDGKSLIVGLEGPGGILGLAENILGIALEKTAASTKPIRATFLRRDSFIELLQGDAQIAFEAMEMLSKGFVRLLEHLKAVGLVGSAQQKLAAFILGLRSMPQNGNTVIRLPGASQEDLAQMVGLSRETTSRLLSSLRKSGVLAWNRSTLIIQDWDVLQLLANPAARA